MLVCQCLFRESDAVADKLLASTEFGIGFEFWITATVESECCAQGTLHQVEGQEGSILEVAAHDETLPARGVPDIFHLMLILVGPEAVHILVWCRAAQKSAGCRPSLLFRVVEVLDPDTPEERVQGVGHIPCGKDMRDVGLTVGVDENAIVQGNPTA